MPRTLTYAERARAECLLADGASNAKVAQALGLSVEEIREALPELSWGTEKQRLAAYASGAFRRSARTYGHKRGSARKKKAA